MDDYGMERNALGEPLRYDCSVVTVANALLDMGALVPFHTLCTYKDHRLDDVAAFSEAIGTRILLTEFCTVIPAPGEDVMPYYEAAASDGPRTTLLLLRGVKDWGGMTLCIEVLPSGLCRGHSLNVRHLRQDDAVVTDASDLVQWIALGLCPEGGVVDNPSLMFDRGGSILGYALDDAAILASTRDASWLSPAGRVGCVGMGESGGTGLTVVCDEAARFKYGLVKPGAKVSSSLAKHVRSLLLDEPECRLATKRIEAGTEALWAALGLTAVEARHKKSKAVEWRPKGGKTWTLAASGVLAAEAMGIIEQVPEHLKGKRRRQAVAVARRAGSSIVSALCNDDQRACFADAAARFEARRVEAAADANANFVAPKFGDERLICAAKAMAKAVASIELDDVVDGARQHSGRGKGGGPGSKKPRGRLPTSGAWATGFRKPAGGSKKPGKRGRGGGPPGGDGDPPDGGGDSNGGRGGGPKKRTARSKKTTKPCG